VSDFWCQTNGRVYKVRGMLLTMQCFLDAKSI
jgi:hypothetical protein